MYSVEILLYQLSEGGMDFSIDSGNTMVKRAVGNIFEFTQVGQVCQTVSVVDDNLLEFDEQFIVDLVGVSPSGVQLQPLTSTSVIINDDEGTPLSICYNFFSLHKNLAPLIIHYPLPNHEDFQQRLSFI